MLGSVLGFASLGSRARGLRFREGSGFHFRTLASACNWNLSQYLHFSLLACMLAMHACVLGCGTNFLSPSTLYVGFRVFSIQGAQFGFERLRLKRLHSVGWFELCLQGACFEVLAGCAKYVSSCKGI